MVFYRKYRPQTIDDLDSSDVRESLSSILSKTPPAHALLFTGPKGLGKTSSARIVAKVVNCTGRAKGKRESVKGKGQKELHPSPFTLNADIKPCGACESCVSITDGTNMDILEIDAASNRGIDEIRDLKEKIRLSPLSAKMKVYIIDEVHMLTTEAFNALLKTLEEPPIHAMFILCTTEQQKVPATILSRCFHIAFKKATEDELVRSFMRIAKGENITVDRETLKFIAGISDGAFRDGVKILEEMSFLTDKKIITKKLIEEKYNVISLNKSVDDMVSYLIDQNVKKALALVTQITDQGIDIKYFTQSLIENIHNRILDEVADGKEKGLSESVRDLIKIANTLSVAYQDAKQAVIPQLPLELAIIDLSTISTDQNLPTDRQGTDLQGAEDLRPSASLGSASVSEMRKQVGNIKKIKAMYGSAKQNPVKPEEVADKESGITLMQTSNGEVTREWLDNLWKNLISEMKLYNHTIAGVLRGCRISGFDKKQLIIETNYKFHKERLDDSKTKFELSRVAKLLTGKDTSVIVELKQASS
ncbi:MAG TPA: DNA polymerase III subunit gamma/tau [Xanthomonadales bacterium]|nr:DNA polymerase III subunit gamma/tau [Xanthomonadales bacterium]